MGTSAVTVSKALAGKSGMSEKLRSKILKKAVRDAETNNRATVFGYYVNDPETHTTKLMSVLKKTDDTLYGVDSDRIESVGTLRLISIMPIVISALRKGAVLVMDELDASLHPMIVMNLISIFHNDGVNKNGAQIIFNTHNPIYLNHNLLRRDEIKFVERDKETKASSLYALSDFRANGEASVRKTSDYMKNYFISRYGAIEDIDFTDIIAEVLKGAERDD